MTQQHRCPICSGPSRLSFLIEDGAAIFKSEKTQTVTLDDLGCRLYCPPCGWQQNGILRDAEVHLWTLKIVKGRFIPHPRVRR